MLESKVLLVVGASDVGKSGLIRSFLHGVPFDGRALKPTVGIEQYSDAVLLEATSARLPPELVAVLPPDGVKLHLWEIGGREGYRKPPRGKQPDGLLLCYDVNDRDSFHSASSLLMQHRMDRHLQCETPAVCGAAQSGNARLAVVLCGTKADSAELAAVSSEEARAFAQTNGLPRPLVSSAATGEGVHDVFHAAVQAIMEAEEEAEAERIVQSKCLPPAEIWSLPHFDGGGMSEPRGLRRHEPSRGCPAQPELVDVFHGNGSHAYGARPLVNCLQRGLYHRAVHGWLCDLRTGGLLLRKYSQDCRKNPNRWGPTCHAEVLSYEPVNKPGAPPVAEPVVNALARALREQVGVERSPNIQDHWFSCSSAEGDCRERLDVYVLPIEGGSLPSLSLRNGEQIQWVHYLDVFGPQAVRTGTLFHIEPEYRASMVKRLQVRIAHANNA